MRVHVQGHYEHAIKYIREWGVYCVYIFQDCNANTHISASKAVYDNVRTYLAPEQPLVFSNRTVDSECHRFEPPEAEQDGAGANPECDPFCPQCQPAGGEDEVVEEVGGHEHGEVERRELHQG